MIVLDTHVLVWFLDDPRQLSKKALKRIENAMDTRTVYVSSISVWEIALAVQRGRLALSMDMRDWLGKVESLAFLNFVPVDNAVAVRSVLLPPPLHSDPADRIIVATALTLDAELVTKDDKLHSYAAVRTLW